MNIQDLDSFTFAIINAPFCTIKNYLENRNRYRIVYDHIDIDKFYFENMYLQPIEGTMKGLIYNPEINPEMTILLGNGQGCWGSLANNISANIYIDNIQITIHDKDPNNFLNELAYYNGKTGKNTREIQAIFGDNGRMEFVNSGTPLWFENTDYYKKRKIIDRLSKTILIEYARKLGVDLTNDNFFKSAEKSLYVEL